MTLKLLFVGDGPRDGAAVPALVSRILGSPVESEFDAWKHLHLRGTGRGLGRKLLYMLRRARDRSAVGVVATTDADRDKSLHKLNDLRDAQNRDRELGHMTPAALGEAIPHLEAWLLDDEVAVRAGLGLPATTQIEAPTKVKSPKDELNRLCELCEVAVPLVELLSAIASQLTKERCLRSHHTGFEQFRKEVEQQLGPLCNV